MNLFIKELKSHIKSLVLWCIGLLVFIAAGMGKYAGLATDDQSLNELILSMPKSLQAIMGAGSLDLTIAIDYYGVLFLYIAIMVTVHAAMLGASIIAKEERDKTVEFLLVKPITRTNIVTAKLLAALFNVMVMTATTYIVSIVMVQMYANDQPFLRDITILTIGLFLLQLLFLTIGAALAATKRNTKSAPALATAILLLSFILSIAIDMNSKLAALKYITPFKYFDAKNMLHGGGIEPTFIGISVVIISILIVLTYYSFQKRDMYV
ncbi:ABC transporter [Bacillus sp. HMF5848]|uniref:ABC transporter permease subunit n=1 Tax=Bacillus sp. HMF5848 TaxID=2495421 RepID=UPI000F798074|nr:ABC transporter permease subunit [Bacillus sp. HMF5848]RSK26049.1 ABC transporter [Bacillus sp. HMF5848]